MSIFSGYKDSIKGLVEGFTVVELKECSGITWDVDLSWRDVPLGCNDLPRLPLVDQICLLQLTSISRKYDVEKCMFVSNLRDYQEAGICLFDVLPFAFFLYLFLTVSYFFVFRSLFCIDGQD